MDALVVLDESECRELLTTMVVGRVAVTTPQGPRGWSVIAHGSCAVVEDPDLLHWASAQWAPEPWAGGDRHVVLMLAWSELTGRRVGGPHWPHPPTPRFA